MWPYLLILILLFVSSTSSAVLAVYAWQRDTAVWSKAYAFMMGTAAWWTFFYVI
jgi:hypothetical protein